MYIQKGLDEYFLNGKIDIDEIWLDENKYDKTRWKRNLGV